MCEPANSNNIIFVSWFNVSVRIGLFNIILCHILNGLILRCLNLWNQHKKRIFGLLCDSICLYSHKWLNLTLFKSMEPAHNKNIRFVIWCYVFKRLRNLGLLCGSMSVRIELFDIVFCGCLVIASNRLNGLILRYLIYGTAHNKNIRFVI